MTPSLSPQKGRAWAIWGIVGGFLSLMFLTVPGWLALRSYRKWRRGEQPRPTFARVWAALSLFFVPVVVIASLAAWGIWTSRARSVEVSRSELGSAWPLSVPNGILSCQNEGGSFDNPVVFPDVTFTVDGTTYELGPLPLSAEEQARLNHIIATDPVTHEKKNLGPLIARGERICPS